MDQVPRPAPDRPACRLEPISDGIRVTATLPRPAALAAMELADTEVWISTTEIATEAGRTVLTADFVPPQAEPFDLPQDRLVFTVMAEEGAVEMRGCAG